MNTKTFLTADVTGFALYTGDIVYSRHHNKLVILNSIWVDEVDGEVFIETNEGNVRVTNIQQVTNDFMCQKILENKKNCYKFDKIDEKNEFM